MSEKRMDFEYVCSRILTLFCCIMPLFYIPYVWDGYYIPKVILLYITVISLVFMMIKRGKNILKYDDKMSRAAVILVLLYSAAVVLSAIFAADIKTAVFGTEFRIEGAVTLLSYVILFLFAAKCSAALRRRENWNIFIVSASVISLYGILQRYGIELLPIDSRRMLWHNQAFSTCGNPNFFGSFLCLCLPFAAVVFIENGGKLIFAAATVQTYALLCSETQGAWLGGLTALVIIIMHFVFNGTAEQKKRTLLLLITAVLLTLIYQANFGTVIAEIRSVFSDFMKVIGYSAGRSSYESAVSGGRYRIFIWEYSVKLIRMFPFFGVGPDCMNLAINRYFVYDGAFRADLLRILDRAHNEYLHTAVSSGITAALLYIMMAACCCLKAGREADKSMKFAILCSAAAYLVQAFFNISVVSAAPVFWIFMGILAG